jgi:hypothetical protein
MAQILGQDQELQINLTNSGVAGDFRNLVCMRNFSVNSELPTTSEETNCGTKTAVGNVSVTVDFDAICETVPTALTQISYEEMLAALNNKTLIGVKISSPSGGTSYYHEFAAYVTSLSLSQEAGAYISFTGTLTSNGNMDILP